MQISITARHCEIASGIRTFAQTRLEKLGKFAADIHGIHVIIQPEGKDFQAEITLRLNGNEFVSTELSAEVGAAVERAADRMEEQLRRYKDRRVGRSHLGTSREIPLGSPSDDYDDEGED